MSKCKVLLGIQGVTDGDDNIMKSTTSTTCPICVVYSTAHSLILPKITC